MLGEIPERKWDSYCKDVLKIQRLCVRGAQPPVQTCHTRDTTNVLSFVLDPPEILSGLNHPITVMPQTGQTAPACKLRGLNPSWIKNLIWSLQVQIAAYCTELNLPPEWADRTGQQIPPRVWCLSNCSSSTGSSIPASAKGSSCTQDDKIFLDLDPEVSPAMAASCNIFTVVVPCSFNGLS